MKFWIAILALAVAIGFTNGAPPKTYTAAPAVSGPSGSIPVVIKEPKSQTEAMKITPLLHMDLKSEDTLHLTGEVGENAVELADQISSLPTSDKPMYLILDSPGGSVLDGAALVSAMEGSRRPIYTICYQVCASMAAIIHQYGVKRFMTDRSILMFHDAAGGAQGYVPHMKAQLDLIDRYTHKMDDYIAKRAEQDPAMFRLKVSQNLWLDSDDSLEQKFSDGTVALHMDGAPMKLHIMFQGKDDLKQQFKMEYQNVK